MNAADIAAIRARAAAATDGPWVAITDNGRRSGIAIVGRLADRGTGHAIAVFAATNGRRVADAEFTAHARQDVDDLLAALAETVPPPRDASGGWFWEGVAPYVEDGCWFKIMPRGGFDLAETGFVPDSRQLREIAAVLLHLADEKDAAGGGGRG